MDGLGDRLTVVIPALNAAATLRAALNSVAGENIIVADGGSADGTAALAEACGARVLMGTRGRGRQLAAGARAATGDWLLFLHADTVLDADWRDAARAFIAAPENAMRAAVFSFALDDAARQARRLERIVAWRVGLLGLPYGDQGLLISRVLYDAIGGYRDLPLMEDVDLARRLGRTRISMLRCRAVTSSARYRGGYLARSGRNLCCLALWFIGVPPRLIAKIYG